MSDLCRMIEAAQRKLREAKFFYQHLANERYRGHDADPEEFRFYFSAFIGAARSVTWIMQKEERDRYAAWEPRWKAQLSPEDQKLEKLTNRLRVDEVKHLGADISATVEEMSAGELMEEMGGQAAFLDSLYPGASKLKSSRPRFFFENDDGRADLLALCKQYLSYLESKVHSFLVAHGVAHD
jgi:hypothetical protein